MNNRSVSSYTNPTQKTFNFHRERRELCDPNLCIDFLLHNQIDEFKNYVDQFPYVVNMKEGQNGNVALHIVSSRGDLGLIKFLIHNGAEVNIQDIFGNSPLHYAADKGKRSAIEILIAAGGNVNLQDYRGNAPLHLACTNNDTDTVKLLLKYNADPEITDLNDMKPGDRTNAPMIKMLLDRRINAVRTQEADAAQQSVQWMSFGVGLGVGLGVALAKHQQMMIEQQLKAMEPKAKKRGNFASVNNKEKEKDDSSLIDNNQNGGAMVPYEGNHSAEYPPSAVSKGSNSRKFL